MFRLHVVFNVFCMAVVSAQATGCEILFPLFLEDRGTHRDKVVIGSLVSLISQLVFFASLIPHSLRTRCPASLPPPREISGFSWPMEELDRVTDRQKVVTGRPRKMPQKNWRHY